MQELTLKLKERTRIAKIYSDWCKSKRIDIIPTTLLGWLETMGYLNTDAIRVDLEKEKEELEDE